VEGLTPEGAAWARRLAEQGLERQEPTGTVLAVEPGVGLVVRCGEDALLIRAGQLEGRRAMAEQALIQQMGAEVGDRLGS
jgi:methionyl-tRNA formyltransferase